MTEVISVRFRNGCKNYYFDPRGLQVKMGEQVIVETAQGVEYATCTQGNHEVEDTAIVQPLSPVVRKATENDRRTVDHNRRRESEAFDICEKKIADHGLDMKLVNVLINFDGSKIVFYFTADGRVDFRELVRDLAGVFRARIELRQIGVRDEAKMIGGLGICGRPFCCSQFLDGFLPVSIKMAKTQNLSLNPTKISGTCGRLMCCLKYEQNAYEDAVKRMPKVESFVQTPDGPGNVKSVDLLQETMKVSLDSAPESLKCYHNCEVRVLRNGKGSREGIEIPAERPKRYIAPETERVQAEDRFTPLFGFQEEPVAAASEAEGEKREKSRRRRRGGRGRGQGKDAAAQPRREESRREPVVQVEKIAVKASGDLTAEKKAAADRRASGERSSHRRGEGSQERRHAAASQQQAAEHKAEGGSTHRRRRRPRRRSGGSGEKKES